MDICLSTEILSMSGHSNSKSETKIIYVIRGSKGLISAKNHLNMPTFNHMIFFPTFLSLFTEAA